MHTGRYVRLTRFPVLTTALFLQQSDQLHLTARQQEFNQFSFQFTIQFTTQHAILSRFIGFKWLYGVNCTQGYCTTAVRAIVLRNRILPINEYRD